LQAKFVLKDGAPADDRNCTTIKVAELQNAGWSFIADLRRRWREAGQ
jgi:hypothetical protein